MDDKLKGSGLRDFSSLSYNQMHVKLPGGEAARLKPVTTEPPFPGAPLTQWAPHPHHGETMSGRPGVGITCTLHPQFWH